MLRKCCCGVRVQVVEDMLVVCVGVDCEVYVVVLVAFVDVCYVVQWQ